jgi:hypothetical protein
VSGEVSGQIYNGRVIRDDTYDMVNHVVYQYFQAADRGEIYVMPPELTEEEELAVDVLISQEEERRAFPGYEALSVAPPPPPGPPPGPPPMQPPRVPPARPRHEARMEPWDPWPRSAPAWPEVTPPPVLGWAPGTPTPGGLAVGTAAVHRPLWQRRRPVDPVGASTTLALGLGFYLFIFLFSFRM